MKGDPNNPADWLRVALRDLDGVRDHLSPQKVHLAAYCLQQTAEKLLKGWLIGQGWSLVKTHDLTRLLAEVRQRGLEVSFFLLPAQRLSRLYFTDRYVDDSADPDPEVTETIQLLADVEKLRALLFPPPTADQA